MSQKLTPCMDNNPTSTRKPLQNLSNLQIPPTRNIRHTIPDLNHLPTHNTPLDNPYKAPLNRNPPYPINPQTRWHAEPIIIELPIPMPNKPTQTRVSPIHQNTKLLPSPQPPILWREKNVYASNSNSPPHSCNLSHTKRRLDEMVEVLNRVNTTGMKMLMLVLPSFIYKLK